MKYNMTLKRRQRKLDTMAKGTTTTALTASQLTKETEALEVSVKELVSEFGSDVLESVAVGAELLGLVATHTTSSAALKANKEKLFWLKTMQPLKQADPVAYLEKLRKMQGKKTLIAIAEEI